jgi:hypothetical protein
LIPAGPKGAPAPCEQEHATSRVVALLAGIDELPPDAYGTFAFGGNPPRSMLRVEERRICWASTDSSARLTDRLRHSIHAPAREFDLLFRDCVDRGKPVGQALVERGWISPMQLRRVLAEHTAAAIAHIARSQSDPPVWLPSREGRHDARFTFTAAEILAHVGDGEWGPLAQVAREELARTLQNGGRGCVYVPSQQNILPAGIAGGDLDVCDVLALGEWAARALAGAARQTPEASFVSLSTPNGESLAAWRRGGFVYAAVCTERSDLACILATLRAETSREDAH